jgi:hypothetical protein
MRNASLPQKNRIVGQEVRDDSGNLVAQEIFEINTKSSSQSIHRTVRIITRFKDKDNEFKEVIMAEAMAVFPVIAESEILMQHLSDGFKEYLSEHIESCEIHEEEIAEETQVPIMV